MKLSWRADPPVVSVATPSSQITIALSFVGTARPARNARLHVAVVGRHEDCKAAVDAFAGATVLTPRAPAGRASFRSIRQALDQALQSELEHLVVLAADTAVEGEDPLAERVDELAARGVVVDFAAANARNDTGPLLRLATRTGGELLHSEGLPARAAARVGTLRVAPCASLLFEARLALDVEPQRVYRSNPAPRAIDSVVYDEETRILRWLGGVAPAGAPLGFALLVNIPRRRHGRHRLMEVSVLAGEERLATAEPTVQASLDPMETAIVEPGPIAAWERAETAWLAEEAGRAFRAGDGRMVSMVLDRLVRQLAAAGRHELSQRSWAARIAFLQSGTLDAGTLNGLRRALAEPP